MIRRSVETQTSYCLYFLLCVALCVSWYWWENMLIEIQDWSVLPYMIYPFPQNAGMNGSYDRDNLTADLISRQLNDLHNRFPNLDRSQLDAWGTQLHKYLALYPDYADVREQVSEVVTYVTEADIVACKVSLHGERRMLGSELYDALTQAASSTNHVKPLHAKLQEPDVTFEEKVEGNKCKFCGAGDVVLVSAQLRKADEATNYLYHCRVCDRGWKV